MQFKVEQVTPRKAENWLAKNRSNRPLSKAVVRKYASAITDGRWQVNAQPIQFSPDGTLLDGQHRLAAIIAAGQPIELVVARGVPSVAQMTSDTGKPRSNADILALYGHANARAVAAAAKIVYAYDHGDFNITALRYTERGDRNAGGPSGGPSTESSIALHWDNQVCLDFVRSKPDLEIAVSLCSGEYLPVQNIARRSVAGACLFIFRRINKPIANMFFDRLAHGMELDAQSPILQLRNRLIAESTKRPRITWKVEMALIIRAWNYHRIGRSIKKLHWSIRSEFPQAE